MDLFYLEEVESTNKYAKENISNLADKTVVYTSNQTSGRGRLQRKWNYLGKDNIYASIVLKPSMEMKEVYSNLTQYLCVVLSETFEQYGVKPTIKWPNDIQIDGKKISGILAEGVGVNNKTGNSCYQLEGLVIGFGVNLNCEEKLLKEINQPATSLNIETGMQIDKEKFLKTLLDKFCLRYDNFIEEGFLLIKDDYIKKAGFLNKEVTVRVFDKTVTGIAKDITDNGALNLVDKDGNEHVLLIGDIL